MVLYHHVKNGLLFTVERNFDSGGQGKAPLLRYAQVRRSRAFMLVTWRSTYSCYKNGSRRSRLWRV